MKTLPIGRLRTGRKSFREKIADANRGDAFYAAMAGVPPMAQTELAPKREYTKRDKPAGELTELQEQIRVVNWWDMHCDSYALPSGALFAIPNGGGRSLIDAANLKRSGVRPGIEDLFLAVPRNGMHGLFIEMKILGGSPSPEQQMMMAAHRALGYESAMAWSNAEAIEYIKDYLA